MSLDVRNRKKGKVVEAEDKSKTTDVTGSDDKSAATSSSSEQGAQAVTFREEKVIILEVPQKWFYALVILSGLFLAVLCAFFLVGRKDPTIIPPELYDHVGENGVLLFQQYDRNNDGYLSIEEFEPIIYRLLETNMSGPIYDIPIEINDEKITLKSYFIPLDKSSMSKDLNDTIPSSLNPLSGLDKWQKPSLEWMNFGASQFSAFLPADVNDIILGKVYDIIEKPNGMVFSSNRYYPPLVESSKSIIIHRLLTLFHPRPFIVPRFFAQGSVACVRAYNEKYVDIAFRIHAEFQLNEPPYHPFWFTPGQFTGNIIMTKTASKILYFNLYVPNEQKLNTDMEWLNGASESENMEVDIGYLPLMQLNSTSSSVPVAKLQEHEILEPLVEVPSHKQTAENIEWDVVISLDDAKRALERALYPFKEVPYYNFTEAFKLAEKEDKLIHSILLWGALDDQSC